MTSYLERLSADMRAAMKSGERDRVGVLRMLIANLKDEALRRSSDRLSEAEEVEVLRKAVKTRREAIAQAEELGRQDVAAAEGAEVAVIEAYLPQLWTGDELLAKVREVAAEVGYSGPSDTGAFMREWMARHKGRADGRAVQDALKQLRP